MKKIIFLDRDGVINQERGSYTWKPEDFIILPGVFETLKELQSRNFLLIIVTNQGGIAKGIYDQNDLNILHQNLMTQMNAHHIHISEIYFCPHHPDYVRCLCRKPSSLLIEKSLARFKASPSDCYFIGDQERDMIAAKSAGVKQIKVEPNGDLREVLNKIPR